MRRNMDLKSLFQVVKKNFVMILAISLIMLLAGVLYAKLAITPMYTTSVKLFVKNKVGDTETITTGDITSSQNLISSYMVFMNDNEVLQKVTEGMEGKYTLLQIRNMLSFEQIQDAMFIQITAESPVPEDSQRLCTLAAANAKTVIEAATETQNINIVGTADTPDRPSSPNIAMYGLLGLVIGFLGSFLVFYFLMARDNTIKGKRTILDYFDVPFFGEVPSFDGAGKGAKSYDSYGYGYK